MALGQAELFDIQKLSISSKKYNEFSLTFIDSHAYCISDDIRFGLNKKEDILGYPLFDIVAFDLSKKNNKKTETSLTQSINTTLNEGSFCIFDSTFYFTRNIADKKSNAQKQLTIFYMHMQPNGEWTSPKPLFDIQPDEGVSYAHPSISKDGQLLFFTSNLSNSEEKADIYYIQRKNNFVWSEPIKLPSTVNTNASETFPYFVTGKGLYFTSDRNETSGLDLYFSAFKNNTFSTAQILPFPYNTNFDDFTYLLHNNEEYISSNREGTDDIFKITPLFPSFDAKEFKEPQRCFVFYEEGIHFLDSVPLKYQWDLGDGTIIDNAEAEHCYDTTGNYLVQLNIVDTISNEIFKNEARFNFELSDPFQILISVPDTVVVNKPFSITYQLPKTIEKQNYQVYFDFGNQVKQKGDTTHYSYTSTGEYRLTIGVIYRNNHENEKKIATFKKIVAVTNDDKSQK